MARDPCVLGSPRPGLERGWADRGTGAVALAKAIVDEQSAETDRVRALLAAG